METKLNDNEVKEVARMQQMIDSYEAFILAASFLIRGNNNVDYPIFARTKLDENMNHIWWWIKEHKDNK
jgi:hypothetical protein